MEFLKNAFHIIERTLALGLFFLFLVLVPLEVLSETLTGKVISIEDGDTITILSADRVQTKIRLYGIDCPEKSQAFGNRAKKLTASLTAQKLATIISYDIDKYQRTVGVVQVDGKNVNEELLKSGLAWQYRKYCRESFCDSWLEMEANAKQSQIGLWKDAAPVAPWDYRKGSSTTSNTNTSPPLAASSGLFHGNQNSHVFHQPTCRSYNCKNCVIEFNNREEAIAAGFRPCGNCKP